MIFPRLLGLSSDDFGPNDMPNDVRHCVVSIVARIGSSNEVGGDYFHFCVATPNAKEDAMALGWGRGLRIIESFSWENVEHSINGLLTQSVRDTWQEVALALNHELLWEYEGCQIQQERRSAL